MPRRQSLWTLQSSNTALAIGARSVVDLGAGLITAIGGASKSGYTATRMIINATYKPTLVGSGHVNVFCGIMRVQDAVFTIGTTAIPLPSASRGPWAWLDAVWIPNNGNEQSSGVFTTWSVIRSFDMRANRRLGETDTMVLVKEAGAAALTVGITVRTLWLIP